MFKEIFDRIEKADVITIFGHVFPDGDCYGSSQGLKACIEHFYKDKKVYVIGTDFYNIPLNYPRADKVDDETIKNSLTFIVDLSNKARVSDSRAFLSKNIIKIDHHIFTEEFGGLEYIDDKRASCSDYIASIFYSKFEKLPPLAASLFFLGMTTDSGRFLYSPSEELLEIGSKLIRDGAEVDKIYDTLYEVSEQSLKFKGYIFSSYKKTDLGVAYMVLDKKTLAKYGYDMNSGAGFVNSIAKIHASKAHIFFLEGENGQVRVELRSSKGIDVQKVAKKFLGGGHLQASGCRLNSLKDYKKVVREVEKELFKSFSPYSRELKTMIELVKKANKTIMKFYRSSFDVEIKEDNSPVTTADKTVNNMISTYLKEHYPTYGILTEEEKDDKSRLDKDYVFILDPLDGTKDFVNRDDMFVVNLALVYKHEVVASVIGVPCQDKIYFAVKDKGSYVFSPKDMIKRIHVSSLEDNLVVMSSAFHINEEYVNKAESNPLVKEVKYVGSALKSCLIAEGKAHICCSFGQGTKEWDTAAPHLLVEEAGGEFYQTNGEKIVYNREDVYNRNGFIATASRKIDKIVRGSDEN